MEDWPAKPPLIDVSTPDEHFCVLIEDRGKWYLRTHIFIGKTADNGRFFEDTKRYMMGSTALYIYHRELRYIFSLGAYRHDALARP